MIYLTDLEEGNTGKLQIYKPYGMTPKDVVDFAIKKTGALKGSFSGRLDPMACGCLNIYLDNSCADCKKDEKLDKIYRFKMAIGMSSSSADLLGYPVISIDDEVIVYRLEANICRFLEKLKISGYLQKQPLLSSYVVKNSDGLKNPLWWWTKHNRIDEIAVVSFPRKLYNYKIVNMDYISICNLAELAIERISLIHPKHDFNQSEIIKKWDNLLSNNNELAIIEMEISVSSGFYVRQLVEDIGIELGIKTITVEIERLAYL